VFGIWVCAFLRFALAVASALPRLGLAQWAVFVVVLPVARETAGAVADAVAKVPAAAYLFALVVDPLRSSIFRWVG
jgi:hypothetical protein